MPLSSPASHLLHHQFGDFDAFAEAVRAWRLEFRQLDPGPFEGAILQIDLHGLELAHARFGRMLDQRGAPPYGERTSVVPASPGRV